MTSINGFIDALSDIQREYEKKAQEIAHFVEQLETGRDSGTLGKAISDGRKELVRSNVTERIFNMTDTREVHVRTNMAMRALNRMVERD